MNLKRYGYKALEAVNTSIKEQMKQTNRADLQNVFFVWHDLHEAIERELDRRALNGQGDNNRVCLNDDLREAITAAGLKQYEVADFIGLSEGAFSRALRKPIAPDRRQAILTAIEELA